jgi:hypothetical protein
MRPGECLEVVAQRTRPAYHQPDIVAPTCDSGERVDEHPLSRQLVEAFDIEDDERLRDSRLGLPPRACGSVGRHEGLGDRRIDDREPIARQAELQRPVEQALTVEGHLGGGPVRAGERIDGPAAAIVPDLRSVQRQHEGHAVPARPVRGDLDDEPIAVQVQQVGATSGLSERACDRTRAAPSVDPGHTRQQRPRSPARAVDGTGQCPAQQSALGGRLRDEGDRVSLRGAPLTERGRQQGIGRLIWRQVRRDVTDAHRCVKVRL